MVRACARRARDRRFEPHSGQLSIWNRKTLPQNEYHMYRQIPLHTHDYLTNYIRNVSVGTDEGPNPKLALSEGGIRENIKS